MSIKYNGQTIAGNYTSQIIGLSNTEKAGIIKIATDEEINTGTSNQVATTPLHLSKKQDKLIAGENVTLTPNENGTTIDVNVPPNVLVDNTTIVKDEADIISAIAVRTKNNEILYDWIGTSEEYENGISDGSISLDWLCYITDDEFVFDSNEIVDNARDTVLNDIGIRTYSINNTYKEKELVITVDENNELKLYRSSVNGNTGHELTDTNYWVEENIGAGMPVGTIFSHTCSASFVPENSLPCNGTEYTQAQFPALYTNWLVSGSLNTCTYEEYESDISTYGKCAKFGLDTTNAKFKVPTIPDGTHIQQAMTDDELGKSYNAGLPDLAVLIKTQVQDTLTSGTTYINTVQTEAVALRYFVVVATGSINQSEMDWSAWASSLQSKLNADHSNDTKPYIIETYVNGKSGYITYSNGLHEEWGYNTASTDYNASGTVSLLKSYKDTNYCAIVGNINGQTNAGTFCRLTGNRTNNSFGVVSGFNPSSFFAYQFWWHTIGYIS